MTHDAYLFFALLWGSISTGVAAVWSSREKQVHDGCAIPSVAVSGTRSKAEKKRGRMQGRERGKKDSRDRGLPRLGLLLSVATVH